MTGDTGLGGSLQPPNRRTGRAARPWLRGHLSSPAGVQARRPRVARLAGARAAGRAGGGGIAARQPLQREPRGCASASAPRRAGPPGVTRGIRAGGEPGGGRGQREALSADRLGFGTETDTNRRRGCGGRAAPGKVQLVTPGLMVLGSPPGRSLGLLGQRDLMIIGKNRVAFYFVLVDFNYT